MAEEFGFFDPVEIAPDVFDREYNANQFTKYFRALVTTGIMKGEIGELKVSVNGANMIVAIDTGVAFIDGRYYRNTVSLPHTLDTESLGRSRIDRVVVRLDMAERKVTSFVKKGVPSASPVAPVLTQTENLYEISIAQVKVVGGQTYVNVADVVDERGKDVICPWAGSNILPNFDDTSIGKPNGIAQLDASGKVPANQLDVRPPSDASTTVKGIVKLNNTLSSTTTTEAATPYAVNSVYNIVNIKADKNSGGYSIAPLLNGWQGSVYYILDTVGFVHMKIDIYGGAGTFGATLFTIPNHLAPHIAHNLPAGTSTASGTTMQTMRINLDTVGTCVILMPAQHIIQCSFTYRAKY